jgi:hypothetical protein
VLAARYASQVRCSPDTFRRQHAYHEAVCDELVANDAILTGAFERIRALGAGAKGWEHARQAHAPKKGAAPPSPAKAPPSPAKAPPSPAKGGGRLAPSFSVDTWMVAVRELNLIGADLSERDALRAFAWSRMAVVDQHTVRDSLGRPGGGQVLDNCLPYEGFLECVCHLAALKAVPSDEQIAAAGCADAAQYMADLKESDPAAHRSLVQANRRAWNGNVPSDLHRCVQHVVAIALSPAVPGALRDATYKSTFSTGV